MKLKKREGFVIQTRPPGRNNWTDLPHLVFKTEEKADEYIKNCTWGKVQTKVVRAVFNGRS